MGRGGRLAGRSSRSSRSKEARSAVEGGSLAGAAGATAVAAGRPDALPHPCLLSCGPHAREEQLRRGWPRVQRPPPPPLFKFRENAKPDRQVSPDKLLRAALLRSRYADVIVKARGILSQGESGDKQELEKLQKEEKERLLAEGNAAMEACRAEAEAESKRTRDLEREKARQALQEMERTVEINDSVDPKDLEMLGTVTTEHIVSSVDETSPEHSQDGMPSFLPGSGSMLEKLGLFMKVDEEEEEDEPCSVPSSKDAEEGEVN